MMMHVYELPETLKSAEMLAGNVVQRGCSVVALLSANSALERAQVLPIQHADHVVVSGASAAWVWGARRDLPLPLELAVDVRRRVSFRCAVPYRRQELTFQSTDVVRLGSVMVCTPPRTVFDLLRFRSSFSNSDRATCRLLLGMHADGREQIEALLAANPRTPNISMVRSRLTSMY